VLIEGNGSVHAFSEAVGLKVALAFFSNVKLAKTSINRLINSALKIYFVETLTQVDCKRM